MLIFCGMNNKKTTQCADSSNEISIKIGSLKVHLLKNI